MLFEDFLAPLSYPALRAVAAHWNEARGSRAMPGWAQIQPARIAPHLPQIWVFKYDRANGEFTGRLAGEWIARWRRDFRGTRLQDIHPAHVFPAIRDCMLRVIEGPCASISDGMLFRQRERFAMGQRLVLPLATDGVHADGVLGVSEYAYPLADPGYAPVELVVGDETWFSLAPAA
ncbi:MAG TPA: PAS domain-containing protein [Rhizomicrobium sp.]